MWVRRIRCHLCGGPKVTPPRTAYVYCSWCGAFTDWDFQIAYATRGSARPGPQYAALKLYLAPQIEAARLRGDYAALVAAHRRLYDQHVRDCPAAYSPRVGDPAYLVRIIEYHARSDADRALDHATRALEAELDRVSRTVFWVDGPEGRVVRPDRFFVIHKAFATVQARVRVLAAERGTYAVHPDAPPPALLDKMAHSAFVQEWLPQIDKATAQAALERTGLASEYEECAVVELGERTCGRCGHASAVPRGAGRVLCETCGALLDAAGADVPCGDCGSSMAAPLGVEAVACPFCRRRLDLVRRG